MNEKAMSCSPFDNRYHNMPIRNPRRSGTGNAIRREAGLFTAIRMELRKLKGSSFWWMAAGMALLVSAWSGAAFMKRAGGNQLTQTIALAANDPYTSISLLAPILAALLTSRLSVMETGGRMDLKWLSLGQSEAMRFLAKFIVAGLALAMCFIIPLVWIPLAARAKGFSFVGSFVTLLAVPSLVALLASLAVTAVQLLISMVVGKQAVGLGIAVIAGLVGSGLIPMGKPQLGWLFPAGISSAADPFVSKALSNGYASVTMVGNPWICVVASLVACVIWTIVSMLMIKIKESRR
ncbi:ABC transporter permease [Bifidobacterium sp. ESL0745]|uniref:ABC transporter permease n=1 Tax=Bifidobacterium sp. ESL0745 TaxID=2983226 RepID=UPI0023F8D6F7|nr:ABC transporter permease [Bifidobacterium sp. ESL0745]MDF7665290.1 ABC transporter permease [Bifidobacterium sp. ESL0745]